MLEDGDLDPTKFEITEREEIILQGGDPDDDSIESAEEEAPEEKPLVDADEPEDELAPEEEEAPPEEEEVPQHWASASDRALAKAFGLSDEEVEQAASREEFNRTLAAVAKRPATPSKQEEPEEEKPAEEADPTKAVTADGKVNVAYYEANDYDEGYVAAMRILRATQDKAEAAEKYQETLAAQQQAAELDRFKNDFMDAADELRPEFYGKSLNDKGQPVKLTNEQANRRAELFDAVQQVSQFIAYQQQAAGRPVQLPSWGELVKRAEAVAHGHLIAEETKKKQTEAVKSQSLRRRPVASTAGATASRKSTAGSDDPAVIASDPEVVAAWERAQAP